MIRRGGCLTLLLAAGALGAGAGAEIPGAIRDLLARPDARAARVVRVIDGDTLLVSSDDGPERVRLLAVDAPEASRTRSGHAECGGRLAGAATRSWVLRARSEVRLGGDRLAPERDRHGRLLAHVRDSRGRDLARFLVRRGLARTVSYERRPLAAHPRLLALEATARGARRGLWSKCPGWARQHAIPFASLARRLDPRSAVDESQPVEPPMVALAFSGAFR